MTYVKDVMVRTPAACDAETNLGEAVSILWNRNCGLLPVVDSQQRVTGVVTDRDLCIAMGTRNRLPGEISLAQVISGRVYSCRGEQAIPVALNAMARHRVRRLVVVDDQEKLEGILSMDDIILHADTAAGRASGLSPDTLVSALKAVYEPQLPQLARAAARVSS